jgi:hypothetical protein
MLNLGSPQIISARYSDLLATSIASALSEPFLVLKIKPLMHLPIAARVYGIESVPFLELN